MSETTRSTKNDVASTSTSAQRLSRACLACRQVKMKCVRTSSSIDNPCVRCENSGRDCVTVTKQVGRKRGSKNKFTDLNKLLRQLENKNIGNSKNKDQNSSPGEGPNTKNLYSLLVEALAACGQEPTPVNEIQNVFESISTGSNTAQEKVDMVVSLLSHGSNFSDSTNSASPSNNSNIMSSTEEFLEDAPMHSPALSNPLALLAQATEVLKKQVPNEDNFASKRKASNVENQVSQFKHLKLAPDSFSSPSIEGLEYIATVDPPRRPNTFERDNLPSGLEYFGAVPNNMSRYDAQDCETLDPIRLSLITEEEANDLFDYYFTEIEPLIFALDHELFTMSYVRNSSPFLLTAICFCAAQFSQKSTKTLTKRLDLHLSRCAEMVISRGYRSVAIILAFCMSCGWASPARNISQEKTWTYLSHATALAIDLGMDTVTSIPISTRDYLSRREAIFVQDDLDHHGISHGSLLAKRVFRAKQRAWLHLYSWGTGLSLTLKRPWTIRGSDITLPLDWHTDPLANNGDKYLAAITFLRKTTEVVLKDIAESTICGQIPTFNQLRSLIKVRLDEWRHTWLASYDIPYLELLFRHGELLLIGAAIKSSYGTGLVPNEVIMEGLHAAVGVCNIFIEEIKNERHLLYMPNNVALMSLFSAVCGLQLLSMASFTTAEKLQTLGILGLTASVLEKMGARRINFGLPTLYGRHLKALLAAAAVKLIPGDISNDIALSGNNNGQHPNINLNSEFFKTGESPKVELDENNFAAVEYPNNIPSLTDLSEDDAANNFMGFQLGAGNNAFFGIGGGILDPLNLGLSDEYFRLND